MTTSQVVAAAKADVDGKVCRSGSAFVGSRGSSYPASRHLGFTYGGTMTDSSDCTEKPTRMVARFVEKQVGASEKGVKTALHELRCMIDEPVIGNGVRGNAMKIIADLDGLGKLYQQLRAAAHKDYGPVEDEP
jgi:hypothetical protein